MLKEKDPFEDLLESYFEAVILGKSHQREMAPIRPWRR